MNEKETDYEKGIRFCKHEGAALKKQITIRLNSSTIEYFKNMAKEVGIPYQTLIDSYLTDCAQCKRKLTMHWK